MPNRTTETKTLILLAKSLTTVLLLPVSADRFPASCQGKTETELRQQVGEQSHFKTTGAGELKDENGLRLGFTAFQSPDGIKLTMTHHRFESQLEAQSYLNKQIAKAAKTLSRTLRKDSSGKLFGERVEVSLHTRTGTDEQLLAIIWTNGQEFYEIVSASMKDNLILERQIPN